MMIAAAALLGLSMSLQVPQQGGRGDQAPADAAVSTRSGYAVPLPTDTSAVAVRASTPPVLDGKADDAIWQETPPITHFREWQPTEDGDPRFRTEARIAYDAADLYVFVRAFDPHPDQIISLLERRDTYPPTDMIWVFLDSYHDRRTGYEFGVNPSGVKVDMAISDDNNEDSSWDAVWEVATRIDSLGWTAEFKIPLSQLRYGPERSHTFGIMIDRNIYRFGERVIWPLLRTSRPGLASQFGDLSGLDDLEAPRRLEAMPYVLVQNASEIKNNAFTNGSDATVGGDVKYRLASNLTLDATINPDFGQVESDPAELNLTAYESFFGERRPFFVAGAGTFRFQVNCSNVNCGGEGLYYSRRIGRTPQLAGVFGDSVPQQPTTILGAAKVLGRFPGGLTLGVLNATTARDEGPGGRTYEPLTNFAAARVTQDFRDGNSTLGGMVTAVNRNLDSWSAPWLASSAYAAGLDFRHRFLDETYEVSGSLDRSRVAGSREMILRLQRNAIHAFQRPDADLPLDSAATVLHGDAEELKLGKVAGQHLLFQSAYMRRSAGFEINDLGFLRRADQQSWATWVGFFDRHERALYKSFQWNNNWWQYWTTAGLPLEAAFNTNLHITFKNEWGLHFGGTVGQLGATYDDRASRGGPAVRQDTYVAPWININGNARNALVPGLNLSYNRSAGGRNWSWSVYPNVDYKVAGRFSSNLSFGWSHAVTDDQWYGAMTDEAGMTRYTFAHLDRTTTSATLRLNYTFTPEISLQAYVEPFVSKGSYSNVRQLSDTPRAENYDDRYEAIPALEGLDLTDPGGFNFKQLTSNVVFRWEYLPGSTLFLVWNEGRQGFLPREGQNDVGQDFHALFGLHPANTFMLKVSYWLNR